MTSLRYVMETCRSATCRDTRRIRICCRFRSSPGISLNRRLCSARRISAPTRYLTNEKKLAPRSVHVTVAALRFLYRVTLVSIGISTRSFRAKGAKDTGRHSQPRGGAALPWLHRELQTPGDPDDMLCRRPAYLRGDRLKPEAIDRQRMVLRVEQGKGQKDATSCCRQVAGGADELLAPPCDHRSMDVSRRRCWRTDIDKRRGCHLP